MQKPKKAPKSTAVKAAKKASPSKSVLKPKKKAAAVALEKKAAPKKKAAAKVVSKALAKPSKVVAVKAAAKAKSVAPLKKAAPLKVGGAKSASKALAQDDKGKKAAKPLAPEESQAAVGAPLAAGDQAPKPARAEKARGRKSETSAAENLIAAATAEAGGESGDDEEIFLTDADGRRYCRVKDCDQISAVDAYCRYHYLLFWKKIQVRKKILTEGKLERYIEELTARYPDKYLEMLRKDLRNEKDFTAAIQELEIDDSGVDNEYEDEAQSYLEEVRGMTTESPQERSEDEY